jgi:hypothetical protein
MKHWFITWTNKAAKRVKLCLWFASLFYWPCSIIYRLRLNIFLEKKLFKWPSFPFTDPNISTPEARSRTKSNPYPSTTTAEKLNATVDQLLEASLARSTKSMFERVWNDFQNFCSDKLSSQESVLPISILHCHCIYHFCMINGIQLQQSHLIIQLLVIITSWVGSQTPLVHFTLPNYCKEQNENVLQLMEDSLLHYQFCINL